MNSHIQHTFINIEQTNKQTNNLSTDVCIPTSSNAHMYIRTYAHVNPHTNAPCMEMPYGSHLVGTQMASHHHGLLECVESGETTANRVRHKHLPVSAHAHIERQETLPLQ